MKEVNILNNLIKMERYQLFHNRTYWWSVVIIFMIGFITADTYLTEVLGPGGGPADSLSDIFNGMVYDSTFLLIIISCILALILGQEFSWRTIHQEVSAGHSRITMFISKVIVYLIAFNILALIYPIAGCIREFSHFGLYDAGSFFLSLSKAAVSSFLFNSPIFLIPVLCCFGLRNMPKALSVTALITFVFSLYLGYGMMLKLPVGFLPTFQIRQAVSGTGFFSMEGLAVAFIWSAVLLFASWNTFRNCELK